MRGSQVYGTDNSTNAKTLQLLAQLCLEIKLTKGLSPWARYVQYSPVEPGNKLKFDAFWPKRFIVNIESGNFVLPITRNRSEQEQAKCSVYDDRYAMRLLFNESPYPPESQWKETCGSEVRAMEFVGRCSESLDNRTRAMNADPGESSNTCIIL
jgi:hypothetical protein